MDDLKVLKHSGLSVIANALTGSIAASLMMCYLGGMQVCWKYIKNRNTGNTSAYNFIAGFALAVNWLIHAVYTKSWVFMIINGLGVFLQTCYIVTFMIYTYRRKITILQLGWSLCLLLEFTDSLHLIIGPNGVLDTITSVICLLNFQLSPLTQLFHVISTKSTSTLPFTTVFACFNLSLLMLFNGGIRREMYIIQVVYGFGVIATGFQLWLTTIFPRKSQTNPLVFWDD